MQRLSRDSFTTVLDPNLPAAITMTSGEDLLVETWDAYMGVWGTDEEPPVTGPASGPIAVEGASPGDALRVDILAIELGNTAMHDVRAGRGFLGETFTQRRPTVMPIEDGHLCFPGGVKIPVRPSVGLIATTPAERQQTASDSGPYGGDIDMQELTGGSTSASPTGEHASPRLFDVAMPHTIQPSCSRIWRESIIFTGLLGRSVRAMRTSPARLRRL